MEGRIRIQLIDAVRGLCVLLMILHHLMWDLVCFLDAPRWLFYGVPVRFLHYIFAGLFVLISGLSCRLSRSNLRRGALLALVAGGLTAASAAVGFPIRFGVLHMLAASMLLYGAAGRLWRKIPENRMPFVCAALFCFSLLAVQLIPVPADSALAAILWPFGFNPELIFSADYFPLFPWIFVFLCGTWFGGLVQSGRLPRWFYTVSVPVLPAVGRHALLIYVLHQPVLFALVCGIRRLLYRA